MMEFSKETMDKALEALEVAKKTGKIKKGTNETTKVIERGIAKLVVVAKDANPVEIVLHLEPLSKEKGVPFVRVDSKEELGTAVGLSVPCVSAVVVDAGQADKLIKQLNEELNNGQTKSE